VSPPDPSSTNGGFPLGATVVASSGQISCDVDDEAVILSLEDGVYYGLNEVASRVWELVQKPRTVREIRDSLIQEYDIEETRCTRDLLDLLTQLHRWKLVELRDGNGASPR
jgi:hypothetical protein